jgi:hypothetical protein
MNMNKKVMNIGVLIGSIAIFIAAFQGSAVNGGLYISATTAGGIWYLLPLAGLAGIISAAMALGGKIDAKIPALIIGGIVLVLGGWFATQALSGLDQLVAMQHDMSQGFNSSFFTGKQQDTSNIPKSSFGLGFYMDLIGSILLLGAGFLSKDERKKSAA